MTGRKRFLIIILAACLFITGCDVPDIFKDAGMWLDEKADELGSILNGDEPEDLSYTDLEPYVPIQPADVNDEPEVGEQVITIENEPADEGEDKADADDASLEQKLADDRYYVYGTLTQEERRVYRQIYKTLRDHAEKTPLPTNDEDLIGRMYDCVMADNPEFFYVKGYNRIRYERGGVLQGIAISGLYTMTEEEAAMHQQRADDYVANCLAGAPNVNDDYQKIKYLYEYIINNTEYDLESENNQNYLSVFENGRSVCQGYASAMQYLMLKMGLFSTVVRGTVKDGETHAWNLVKSNGDYYYVDVTFGEASYNVVTGNGADFPSMPDISYDYLCVTTEDISTTHTPNDSFMIPECTAMYDNYFVRQGCYFTGIDEGQLRRVFDEALAGGESMVCIKCSDPYVYNDMRDYLTSDNRVCDYLYQNSVRYACIDARNEMFFFI